MARAPDAYDTEARARHLTILGAAHEGTGTVLLLAPDEPGFWPAFSASPEYRDGAPDPMDRWSKRVIGALAEAWGGVARFPSDGPPYPPFITWALASGRLHSSPVGMLVHDRAGLWVSFRGAVILPERLDLPPPPPAPCEGCSAPCLSACPVGALGPGPYDTVSCHAFLDTEAGGDCMTQGCAVRRACPAGAGQARLAAQSAFHMRAFHPE